MTAQKQTHLDNIMSVDTSLTLGVTKTAINENDCIAQQPLYIITLPFQTIRVRQDPLHSMSWDDRYYTNLNVCDNRNHNTNISVLFKSKIKTDALITGP